MNLVEPHLVFRMPPPEPHGLWIVVPWHVLYKQQLQRRLQLHTQKKLTIEERAQHAALRLQRSNPAFSISRRWRARVGT